MSRHRLIKRGRDKDLPHPGKNAIPAVWTATPVRARLAPVPNEPIGVNP